MSVSSKSRRLSSGQLAVYAFPGLATAIPTIPVLVLLPQFYATATTLTLSSIGIALLLARLFDMVTDPLVGTVIDAVPTRWGKRKPWIILGGLVCAPALLLLATPPESTSLWLLTGYLCLLYAGWTLFSVPYNALGAELSTDGYERTRLASSREGAVLCGIVMASALPVVLTQIGVPSTDQFLAISWITISLGAAAIILLGFRLVEPTNYLSLPKAEKIWKVEQLRSLIHNKPFTVIMACWFLNGLANGTGTVLFPFFLTDVLLTSETQKNLLIFLYFFMAIVGLPIWLLLNKRFNKSRLWLSSILIVSVTFTTVPFMSAGDVVPFAIVCVITGFCLGADLALPASLFADVTDWDELQSKHNRRSFLYSLWTLITKLSLAIAAGICLPLISFWGFKTGEENAPETLTKLAILYAMGPVCLKVGILLMMWNFPIGRKAQRAIQSRLRYRAL
ncbi:MFS transporter [Rhodobacteraceae bacterium RKSG542]|uniref:MFS transporter n=1 Tax=Pseudovibrio flavus TaxID=2529854 RepID=UPI0012BC548F|nr:MFS transporter [Pseudovibrio flavus]MTI16293.1 MFS transporter [Pseudovibrio flavus]